MHHRLLTASLISALGAFAASASAEQAIDPTLTSAPGGAQVRKNKFQAWYPAAPGRKLPADSELTCAAGCYGAGLGFLSRVGPASEAP